MGIDAWPNVMKLLRYDTKTTNKRENLDLVKIKTFCASKDTVEKVKIQLTEWEKIFANLISVKVYEEFFSLVQFSSVSQSCPTLCDPVNCSTPGHTSLYFSPILHLSFLHSYCNYNFLKKVFFDLLHQDKPLYNV